MERTVVNNNDLYNLDYCRKPNPFKVYADFNIFKSLKNTKKFVQFKDPLPPTVSSGLPGLKPRFYLLLYDFFGPDSMTFYDHFMTF